MILNNSLLNQENIQINFCFNKKNLILHQSYFKQLLGIPGFVVPAYLDWNPVHLKK